MTGLSEVYSIEEYLNWLSVQDLKTKYSKRVIHLFYELGHVLYKGFDINQNDILAIDLNYNKKERVQLESSAPLALKLVRDVNYFDYKQAFDQGYRHLQAGDCYQFNLTYPFDYEFSAKLRDEDFLSIFGERNSKRGAFAHATFLPLLNRLFLSNSPEMLIQGKRKRDHALLWSAPIKGSLSFDFKKDSLKEKWKELTHSMKDQAELFMIADLLRNDLNRIDLPIANVVAKKRPLVVPGILHQYSLLSVRASLNVTLLKLIQSLFPGGSVTGAPKKRVLQILKEIELESRGFYCGSTFILDDDLMAASINIRSATIDFVRLNMRVNAGGGITLKSDSEREFDEMILKRDSFMGLFLGKN